MGKITCELTIGLDWDTEQVTRFFRAVNFMGCGPSEFCRTAIKSAVEIVLDEHEKKQAGEGDQSD